jgi:hypothetical protein
MDLRQVLMNRKFPVRLGRRLPTYYGTLLAKAESEGHNPDYAQALHQAKKSLRNQDQWKRPYFWARFTIVGAK